MMGWDSIHNPLLQSALKSYKAITGLQVALSSSLSYANKPKSDERGDMQRALALSPGSQKLEVWAEEDESSLENVQRFSNR